MEKYLGIGFIVFCISFLIWWFAVGYEIAHAVHYSSGDDNEFLGFAFGWVGAIPCALITAILWPLLAIALVLWILAVILQLI